jgi:hypothetical protein
MKYRRLSTTTIIEDSPYSYWSHQRWILSQPWA